MGMNFLRMFAQKYFFETHMSKNKHISKANTQSNVKKTVPKQTTSLRKDGSKLFDFIGFIEKNRWVAFGFLSALFLLLSFIVFGQFISGRYYYMFKDIGSDSVTIFYPYWVMNSELIREFGYPLWSFNVGMGQSVYGNLLNPLGTLVFFSKEMIVGMVVFYELAKIFIVALLSFTYFKSVNYANAVAILGALFISFSGYVILGSGWYGPTVEVLYAVLFLVAFEQIFKRNRWWLFLVGIFFYATVSLAFIAVFIAVYALFRLLEEKLTPWQWSFWAAPVKMIGLGVLGGMLVAIFFVPVMFALYNSPRIGGDSGYFTNLASSGVFTLMPTEKYITQIFRFYSNDILGNGIFAKDIVGNWENYFESPASYIGLFTLLLFPQVFILAEKREKWLYGIYMAIWLLPLIFPYFRYAFWLFSGDYYRLFSFLSSLVLLFMAMKVLNALFLGKKINIQLLFGTGILLIVLLYLPYAPNASRNIRNDLRIMATLVLAAYMGILWMWQKNANKSVALPLIFLLALIELGVNAYSTANMRYMPNPATGEPTKTFAAMRKSDLYNQNGYYNSAYDAVEYIKKQDSSFFRLNKEFSSSIAIHSGLNDAMVLNYYGTTSYSSFNQLYYINFLKETNVIRSGTAYENETRWSPGLSGRPLLQSMASVKYDLSVEESPFFLNAGYSQIHQVQNVKILKNNYALPLGFVYRNYITIDEFRKLSNLQKDIMLLRAFVADGVILNPDSMGSKYSAIASADTISPFSFEVYKQLTDTLRADSLHIVSFAPHHIVGKISIDKPGLLFFSIPYDLGWHAKVNGEEVPVKLTNIGFVGIELQTGDFEVELSYTPAYLHEGTILSFTGLGILLLLIIGEVVYAFLQKRKNRQETV